MKKDQNAPVDLLEKRSMGSIWSRSIFLKINGIDSLKVNMFKRLTRAIWSRSIFLKDRQEPFDHGWSFLKIEKIKRSLVILRDIITSILVFKIMLSFCKITFWCKKIVPIKVIILMLDGDKALCTTFVFLWVIRHMYVIVQCAGKGKNKQMFYSSFLQRKKGGINF